MKKKVIIGGVVALVILVITIVVYLANTNSEYNNIDIAIVYTQKDLVPVQGIALKEEVVIDGSYGGKVSYIYEDGVKVMKDHDVALVYANEQDAINQNKIEALEKELESVNQATRQGVSDQGYANILSSQIQTVIEDISNDINHGDLTSAADYKNDLTELLTVKNISMGQQVDLSIRQGELNGEIAALKANTNPSLNKVKAPVAGFFVSSVDGHENEITLEQVLEMNSSDLKAIIESEDIDMADTSKIGKMIDGYDWYFATVVPNELVPKIQDLAKANRGKIDMNFTFEQSEIVTANLYDIRPRANEDETIVVFEFNNMNANFATLRKDTADIVFGEYRGIRVPTEAIRFEDDKIGVYVKIGNEVQFQRIEILYEGKDYVISKIHDDIQELRKYLQPNDIVIINYEKPTPSKGNSAEEKK